MVVTFVKLRRYKNTEFGLGYGLNKNVLGKLRAFLHNYIHVGFFNYFAIIVTVIK